MSGEAKVMVGCIGVNHRMETNPMSGEAKVMVGVTSWAKNRAEQFRAMAEKAGGREFTLKRMLMQAAENAAGFGRLSHEMVLSGEDRQYAQGIADYMHDQGFLCAISELGGALYLLVSWAGQPSSEEP